MIHKHDTFPKFCQLLNIQWILVSEDLKITVPTPQSGGSAMLHETWRHFLPQQFSPFQAFLAHVKSLCLSLHGAAGSQPWRKFKPCGLEHASSCQKNPNLSVPGPFWERGFGQSNQSLTTSQCNSQPRWRASPQEPGSASHSYNLLSQGLSCMNFIPHWSWPSSVEVRQSSVNLVARYKLVFYI